ncbi:MAG: hypothetical protein U0Q55_09830 [Vicinamibacterales bacterium]
MKPLLMGGGVALAMSCLAGGCAWPVVKPTGNGRPSAAELAQLWIDPGRAPRDLTTGVGGSITAPVTDDSFTVLSSDSRGFSVTYRVRDRRGAEWNVKIGPEAQPETVASRILWAVGYHQVPSYFVERWTAFENGRSQTRGGARFRPRAMGLKSLGSWSWQRNPFVGTREYNGLLSVLMLLNSTDLKNDNNGLYEVEGPVRERARRWYVVKDLGASLGETGRVDPRRGYLDGFEREPFLLPPDEPFVRFAFRGRHQELLQRIPIADLQWASQAVLRISDRQWRDAFRAGNYDEESTTRYVARIRAKAQEALALE